MGTAAKDQPALGFLAITQATWTTPSWPARSPTCCGAGSGPGRRPCRSSIPDAADRPAAHLRSAELQAGFKPVQAFAAGGGDIAAFRVEDKKLVCAGYVSAVPSYSFTWTGKPQAIRLFLEARRIARWPS